MYTLIFLDLSLVIFIHKHMIFLNSYFINSTTPKEHLPPQFHVTNFIACDLYEKVAAKILDKMDFV